MPRKRERSPGAPGSSKRFESPQRVAFSQDSSNIQGSNGARYIETRSRTAALDALHSSESLSQPNTWARDIGDTSTQRERYRAEQKVLLEQIYVMLNTIENDSRRPASGPFSYEAVFKFVQKNLEVSNVQDSDVIQLHRYLLLEQIRFRDFMLAQSLPRGKVGAEAVSSGASTKRAPSTSTILLRLTQGIRMAAASRLLRENIPYNDNGKDAEVCERMASLIDSIRDFSLAFPTNLTSKFFDDLLAIENEQLIRYLGCLAIAGKHGEDSWRALLTEGSTRSALVMGVVSHALKEHVFSDLWFGGRPDEKETLSKMEQDNADIFDGFPRTEERAKQVQHFAREADPSTFRSACTNVTRALAKMLSPFWDGRAVNLPIEQTKQLLQIVADAGTLSRDMRQVPDVIYYWPLTVKDEEFEPSHMECLNLKAMMESSPYWKRKVGNLEHAVIKQGNDHRSEAIVRIVCFPSLVAYRCQGGQLGEEQLRAEEQEPRGTAPPDVEMARRRLTRYGTDSYSGTEGFRSKIICKSVVYLAWDQQRLLTKEAGTSTHLNAQKPGGSMQKYEDDYQSFVELYDLARQRWRKS